jgi:hypothetical protein
VVLVGLAEVQDLHRKLELLAVLLVAFKVVRDFFMELLGSGLQPQVLALLGWLLWEVELDF